MFLFPAKGGLIISRIDRTDAQVEHACMQFERSGIVLAPLIQRCLRRGAGNAFAHGFIHVGRRAAGFRQAPIAHGYIAVKQGYARAWQHLRG